MDIFVYIIKLCTYFFLFSFIIYWTHRAAHKYKWLWYLHKSHHEVRYTGDYEFSWWNLIGWFNGCRATADQWVTEIIPLILMIWVWPPAWPLAVLYYLDGFILAEGLTDHNPRINIPGLAMGRYHLLHHKKPSVNFDQYFHIWDWIFGTMQAVPRK